VFTFINDLERGVGSHLYGRRMYEATGQDLSVGGPDLASQAMAAGLVDEIHLFVTPVTVGGRRARASRPLPRGSDLELVDVDRFKGGVVHLQ
jgi:riboflavin biosynthesis pyrimidine reductase